MDILFLTYLLVMCEAIGNMVGGFAVFFSWASAIGVVVTIIMLVAASDSSNDDDEEFDKTWQHYTFKGTRKIVKWVIGLAIFCHFTSALIPSQKNMAIIVGSTGAYMALTSDPAKKLGNKAFLLLEKKIDDALKSEDNGGQAKEKEESKSEEDQEPSGKVQQSGQST